MRVYASGLPILAAVMALAFVQSGPSPPAGGQRGGVGPADDCPADPRRFHPCALAKARAFAPPRTREGVPDLQGFWRGPSYGNENVEDHPATPADTGGPSLIIDPPDGRIPYRPWAAAQARENRRRYIDPNVPCFLSGVPRSVYVPTTIQIVQPAGYVLLLFERAHGYRIIPTRPAEPPDEAVRLWQGYSRGRWDGTSLVVEVTHLNGKTWLDQAGNFYSDAARLTERFTPVDPNTLHYQATIEDPYVYTRPWTMAFPLRRVEEAGFELLEEACHEGERNTDMRLQLGYRIYPGVSARDRR